MFVATGLLKQLDGFCDSCFGVERYKKNSNLIACSTQISPLVNPGVMKCAQPFLSGIYKPTQQSSPRLIILLL